MTLVGCLVKPDEKPTHAGLSVRLASNPHVANPDAPNLLITLRNGVSGCNQQLISNLNSYTHCIPPSIFFSHKLITV